MTANADNEKPSAATRLREVASQLHFDDYERLSFAVNDEDQAILNMIAEEGVALISNDLVFKTLHDRNRLTAEHFFRLSAPPLLRSKSSQSQIDCGQGKYLRKTGQVADSWLYATIRQICCWRRQMSSN